MGGGERRKETSPAIKPSFPPALSSSTAQGQAGWGCFQCRRAHLATWQMPNHNSKGHGTAVSTLAGTAELTITACKGGHPFRTWMHGEAPQQCERGGCAHSKSHLASPEHPLPLPCLPCPQRAFLHLPAPLSELKLQRAAVNTAGDSQQVGVAQVRGTRTDQKVQIWLLGDSPPVFSRSRYRLARAERESATSAGVREPAQAASAPGRALGSTWRGEGCQISSRNQSPCKRY